MKEVIKWVARAGKDLRAANINLKQNLFDVAAFLSHQAAEKALKALYILKFKRLWKIHDLEKLALTLSADKEIIEHCTKLNPHYMDTRYPIDINYNKKMAEDAVKCSEAVVKWAKKRLKK
ncbi:MAG: HEPN domain-containing protein [Candidatus Aenigmarchaeota archaeon]|nr:HEPN domain-containing protein [Candidatus Aenigmarchaeota archaeon]